MRAALGGFLALLATGACAAEQGCEHLAWKLDAERALLASAAAGPEGTAPPLARRLVLKPLVEASLPKPPERASPFAGAMTVSVPEEGLYRVTLDSEGWLDIVQNDAYRQAEAFTGVRGCPGIRKSVRFRLDRGSAVVQVSGKSAGPVAVAVTREE